MAGGPWIKPENAMRTLVKSRTDVSGQDVNIILPKPQPSDKDWLDYHDIAVLAFPTPAGDDMKLDLGVVSSIAEVKVNGKHVRTLWCSPYIAEIGEYVQQGENILEIEVTSTWFNRLVYDASLKEPERKTWVINGPDSDMELIPYGLMGPVFIK